MAENAASARKMIEGHRREIRESIEKHKRYTEDYEKRGQVATIQNAQSHIAKLKEKHPSLKHDSSSEDTWKP